MRPADKIITGDRKVSHDWYGPETESTRHAGETARRVVRVSVTHNKDRKRYEATVSTYTRENHNGYVIESHKFSMRNDDTGDLHVTVGTEPVTRYGARTFDEFAYGALVTFPNGSWDDALTSEAREILAHTS